MTPEIKAALTQNKAELLLMLEQGAGSVPCGMESAAMLNHLFREQGTSGRRNRARITAATVRRGEETK